MHFLYQNIDISGGICIANRIYMPIPSDYIKFECWYLQLQRLIKQEMERNEYAAHLANPEFIFFLVSPTKTLTLSLHLELPPLSLSLSFYVLPECKHVFWIFRRLLLLPSQFLVLGCSSLHGFPGKGSSLQQEGNAILEHLFFPTILTVLIAKRRSWHFSLFCLARR